jgi:oligopeptide transport system substrate-binding protein
LPDITNLNQLHRLVPHGFLGRASRGFFRFFYSLLLLNLITGCGSDSKRADLVFLNGQEPESLDPALITGQPEERLAMTLFDGLTHVDRSGHLQPAIAISWDLSSSQEVYTFRLRPNVHWSNGALVTAEDFEKSWERVLTPETASEDAYMFYPIKNAQAFNEGKLKDFSQVGIKALDAHTLQVELNHPTPYFPDLCATMTFLPVYLPAIQKYGDDWIKPGKLVCNGPYTLKEWRLNYRIRLVKNPEYWDAAHVQLQIVDILPIDNSITAFNFYASHAADLILDKGLTPSTLMADLKKRPDFHSAPFLGTYFIGFNTKRRPFTDARVRQAFALAIDRERIVTKITQAGEPPAYSLTPPGTQSGYQPPTMPKENVARAKELLAEAGYPNGKGFPVVSYLYDNKKLNEDIAIELQSMFAENLGVHIQLVKQEWKVYLTSLNSLDFDFARRSWVGDYNDPMTFLDCYVTGGGNNRTGWNDPRYDRLIEEANQTSDPKNRLEDFYKAENILLNDGTPICPLFYMGINIYDPQKLGGIEPNLLDEHPIREMYRRHL